jgi:hypothetical protein
MKFFRALLLIGLVGGLLSSASAAEPNDAKRASAAFERLKKLEGEWVGKASHGDGEFDVKIVYKVISGGSAVQENLFPESEHEMVTMYHLNKGELMLTHYCACGNQPRMKGAPSQDGSKLTFTFLDGTNMDPAVDMFMHDATIELVDDDHLKSEWVAYQEGKQLSTAKFDVKRKKD